VHHALLLAYEVLVFCENLEPMLRLHEYQWLEGFLKGRPALALFRGAPGYFRTDVANELLVLDHRPVLAFFDFDPKGLSMACRRWTPLRWLSKGSGARICIWAPWRCHGHISKPSLQVAMWGSPGGS
jgi:hypothetical protein